MTAQDIATTIESLGIPYFHDPKKGFTYLDVDTNNGQPYCRQLGTSDTDGYLQKLYYGKYGRLLPNNKMKELNAIIEFIAKDEGNFDTVFNRVAKQGNKIYIDLGGGQFVRITKERVSIVKNVPVKFIHNPHNQQKVNLDINKGNIKRLRKYLNVSEDQFKLILVFIINCFITDTHHLLLLLIGPAGSSKSFIQKILKTIIDPSNVMLRNKPRNVEDLIIAAGNCYMPDYNNLSILTKEMQDTICTILTGGCASTRQLYSNKSESVIYVHNPVIANGIGNIIDRDDLFERSITISLNKIKDSDTDYVSENALWSGFEEDLPVILVGIFNLLNHVLDEYDSFKIPKNLSRMADFHILGLIIEKVSKWEKGTFEAIYLENIANNQDDILVDSKVGQALLMMKKRNQCEFKGTYQQLLIELNRLVKLNNTTPRGLSAELDCLSGALQNLHGIKLTKIATRSSAGKCIKINVIEAV